MKFSIGRSLIAIVILLVVAAFSGSKWMSSGTEPGDAEPTQTSVAECKYSSEIAAVEDPNSLLMISDPFLGNYEADVTVIEYFDPNCSHCKAMHPIMHDLVDQYGKDVRFFMIPMALWQYSLPQVESLYVAAQSGMYYEMLDLQFEMQTGGGMAEETVRELAGRLDLDGDDFITKVKRGMYQQQIMERRTAISNLGVTGTPTVVINGRFVDGTSKSAECLSELIQAELDG